MSCRQNRLWFIKDYKLMLNLFGIMDRHDDVKLM